jgi:hypothetical protein
VAGSGGEKSKLGTLFKDAGVAGFVVGGGVGGDGGSDGGSDVDGGGGGSFVFGGRFVAKDRRECVHARRGTDLANTANIWEDNAVDVDDKTGILESFL